ncbi:hypothetical protein LTR95_011133 [Oleoguttula sp. CCFEE 5521]
MASKNSNTIDLCEDSEEDEKINSAPVKKASVTRAPSKPGRASQPKQASTGNPPEVINLVSDPEETSQSSQKRSVPDKRRQPGLSSPRARSDVNESRIKRTTAAHPSKVLPATNRDEAYVISDDEVPTKKIVARISGAAAGPASTVRVNDKSTTKRSRTDEVSDRLSSPPSKRARHTGPDVKISTEAPRRALAAARNSNGEENRKASMFGDAKLSAGLRTARDIENRAAQADIEKSRKARLALADYTASVRSRDDGSLRRAETRPSARPDMDRDSVHKIAESPVAGSGAPAASSPATKKPGHTSTERKAFASSPTPALKVATPPPQRKRPPNSSTRSTSSPKERQDVSATKHAPSSTSEAAYAPGQANVPEEVRQDIPLVADNGRGRKEENGKIGLMGTLKAGFNALMGPPKSKTSSTVHAASPSTAGQNQDTGTQLSASVASSPRRTTRGAQHVPDSDDISVSGPGAESPLPAASSRSNATPAASVTTATPLDTVTSRSTPTLAMGVIIQLTPLQQFEQTLEKYAAEMRADTSYSTQAMLRRARLSASPAAVDRGGVGPAQESKDVASSIFARLSAMPLIPVTASSNTPADAVRVNVETSIGKASVKSHYVVKPTICDTSGVEDVPGYTHYVSLKDDLLAPNVLHMNVWPYFGDEYVKQDTFGQLYHVDTADRERKLRRLLQAQRAEEYARSALDDLGITWSDVLHFLLDRNGIGTAGLHDSMKRAVSKAATFRLEDFPSTTKDGDKWVYVLSYVSSQSRPQQLGKAALLCDCFQSSFKLPLWHLARRSDVVRKAFEAHERQPLPPQDRTCRVCFHFNCSIHGEYREEETDDADPGMEEDAAVATDLVHPEKVNRRKRMSFLPTPNSDKELSLPFRLPTKKKGTWDPNAFAKLEERSPFYPCYHPGKTCEAAGTKCTCVEQHVPCEKTCDCISDCARRFQGCTCKAGLKALVCFEDNRCDCFQLGRECDPDLCGLCDVNAMLDPEHGHELKSNGRCRNLDIQRARAKLVLLGDSGVHGMGLYAGEAIRADEFIGEYVGEVITTNEGERRGAVYEHQFLSYLFSLNKTQEVDATYYGNEMRFMNHRPKNAANVYPRVKLVNTVHRIALYGQRPIKPGEELFFDYGPQFPEKSLKGEEKVGKNHVAASAPHVRNKNLVSNFYDVEDTEDAAGNVIARKATSGRRPKVKTPKSETATPKSNSQGAARAGADRKPIPSVSSAPALPAVEADNMEDAPASPGHRLSAYYTSEDKIVDAAAGADAKDDEDFDPDASEDEAQGGSESEASAGDQSEAEVETPKKRRGRPKKYTR